LLSKHRTMRKVARWTTSPRQAINEVFVALSPS